MVLGFIQNCIGFRSEFRRVLTGFVFFAFALYKLYLSGLEGLGFRV